MATSRKVTDKFLTCTVCMEIFTDPSTLECQHTFCGQCLVNFTKTQPEAVKAKSIPCPCCQKLTKVPNPDRPVEEWTKELKPSFVIEGLIDSFGSGTKDTNFCSYCKEEGETTPASVWCSDCDDALCDRCARMHKRIPSAQKHDVIGLSEDVKIKRKRKVLCKEHNDEKVEFLCKDCKKAVCHKCCTLYHRKCDSVVTLESELPSMTSSLTKSKEEMKIKLKEIMIDAENLKSRVTKVTKSSKQTELEIRTEIQKVRELINLKEKKLLDELKEETDKELGKLKADIKTKEMAIHMYQQQSELIDQAVKSDCDMDIYEMYRSCESGATESVDDTNTDLKNKRTVNRIHLRKNTDKLIKALSEIQLGEIDVVYDEGLDLTATLVLQDPIHVGVTGDKHSAGPSDVTVMNVNGIDTVVVTDWNQNNSVKSFYKKNNKSCHSKLILDEDPWSLTQMKHNQVAVTVPDTSQIVIVEVNPDLKLLSTITTSKQYRGITALTPSTIVASSQSPPSVDILDMEGIVIRSITPHINNENILQSPKFLCTTKKGNILVSDYSKKSVVCLTPQGDVMFNYSPSQDTVLNGPQGITVTNTGDILVADFSLNHVLHLTESGQFVRNILSSQDGLSRPYGICVDKRGPLYVCMFISSVIKVYNE